MRAPRQESAFESALAALAPLDPVAQLDAAEERLRDGRGAAARSVPRNPLARFDVGDERRAAPDLLDGRLLEAICQRALGGARGAVFTPAPEATILAAFGLAHAAAIRDRRVAAADVLAALLGVPRAAGRLHASPRAALDGLRVLDFACGGGALLVAAELLARRVGARLALFASDLSPLAARATASRLSLVGAHADVRVADAVAGRWPEADLVLANPPFVRHEALAPATKAAAARASGLSRQADLSAHLAALAIRAAPVAALVLPRALDTARSAGPFRDEARARGGFALRLRSSRAASFAASVDAWLAVWVAGGAGRPPLETSAPLEALAPATLAGIEHGRVGGELRQVRDASAAPSPSSPARRGAATPLRVRDVARVRFGMKSGANGFFHLTPLGDGRYHSALAGRVELSDGDVAPLLASLKEARAPALAEPTRVLFRPAAETATALAYVAAGVRLGVAKRPTCAGRSPWWRIAPDRPLAPVLYPAKIGARAFAFLNEAGFCEDKKWHALFATAVEPWLLAAVLGATPVRLAIDAAARQLTGAQAIADVDCGVLAAAPFPAPAALARVARPLEECWRALACDPVTTDLAAALGRDAQRELDAVVGRALGMSDAAVAGSRRELLSRVDARLAQAEHVRAALRDGARNTPAGRGVGQRGVLAGHPGRQLPPPSSQEPFTP